MTRGVKPSKGEIIEAIKRAAEEGIDLRHSSVQKSSIRWAYRAFKYYFSSWQAALAKAGISYKDVRAKVYDSRREEAKKLFLAELKIAYEAGRNLSVTSIQESEDRGLYDRSKRFYDGRYGWENALREAGLPVEQIVRQRRWDRERVREELIKRRKQKKPISSLAIKKEDTPLYKAARTHFGSYEAALIAAGFDPRKILQHKEYSDLEITLKIIELHSRGEDLNCRHLSKSASNDLKKMVQTVERHRGGWEEAVNKAGIDYTPYRRREKDWDREKVLQRIKILQDRGEPLNAQAVPSSLHHAAYRYVGGWDSALLACGINPEEVRLNKKPLSREEILERIKQIHEGGGDLSVTAILSSDEQKSLYYQATRKFDGWANVLEEAGIPYNEVRKVRGEYTLGELKEEVKKIEQRGVSLELKAVQADPIGRRITRAIQRRFDSWADFLRSIGKDPTKYCAKTDWKDGEGVKEYLRENFPTGLVSGASRDRNFAAAVRAYFDSVEAAVNAAGMVYSRRGKVTREMLKNPEIVGRLYRFNQQFLEDIVKNILYRRSGEPLIQRDEIRSSLEKGDLLNSAFIAFIEFLPHKPANQGIREFCYERIRKELTKQRSAHFKEVRWDKDVYFDLALSDREEY